MSCVPVCCAEIRRLSGPVTVYSIIFGDGGRGDVFISLLSSRAALSYSIVCLIQRGGVNGSCLLNEQAFLSASSLRGIAASQHVQDVLSP